MAINRFSRPAQATIRETQVLPDIGFMTHQLEKRQQRYDINSMELAKTEGDLSGLQGYGKAAGNYIKSVDDKFKVLSEELLRTDLGDPKNVRAVRDEIYKVKNDPILQKHIAAKRAYDNYQKMKQDIGKDGNLPLGNIWEYEKAWKRYDDTGEFDPSLTTPMIAKGVDRITEMDKLFKEIKASGGDALRQIASQAGSIYYQDGWKGIGGKQIKGAVADNLDTIVNSPLGRELTREFNMLKEMGNVPAKTAIDYIIKTYEAAGKRHEYSETSSGRASALNRKLDLQRQDAKDKKDEQPAGMGYMPAMSNGKKVDIDSDGRINVNPFYDMWEMVTGEETRSKEQLQLEKTLREGAKRSGVPIKEYVAKLNQDPNVKISYYNSKKADEMSTRFFNPKTGGGDFWTRKVFNSEYPNGISAKEYMETKGLTEDDLRKGFTVIGEAMPDNPFTPKGMTAMIGGEPVIIDDMASINVKTKEGRDALYNHEANKAKYNGEGIHTATLGGVKFTWQYNASKDIVEQIEPKHIK